MVLQLCFAYKLSSPIEQIGVTVYIDGDSTAQKSAVLDFKTTADNQWHYTCIDLYQGLLKSWATTAANYPSYRLTLLGVS